MARCLALLVLLLVGCSRPDDAAQIEKQLDLFANYSRSMNHFGVAALFADDGVMEGAAPGRKAIQQYLATNSALHVSEFAIDAGKPAISGDRATQEVTFQKQVRTAQGTSVQLTGKLKFEWVRAEGRWMIARLSNVRSGDK